MIFRQLFEHVSSTYTYLLGGDKTLAEFVEIMRKLDLDYPRFIDYAVPGNRECGVCPTGVPENLQQYCGQIGDSVQG